MSWPTEQDHPPAGPALRAWALAAAGSALAYVVFYFLNGWLFSTFKVSENIAWIFLPAAIRMVAVLLAGWAGVAGLFIGSLAVMIPTLQADPVHALTLATLSSVPSLYAAQAVRWLRRIPGDLAGMTGRDLLAFGLAGGLANSAVHTLYFMARAGSSEPLGGFLPMFVGDAIGTVVMLYAGARLTRLVRLPQQGTSR